MFATQCLGPISCYTLHEIRGGSIGHTKRVDYECGDGRRGLAAYAGYLVKDRTVTLMTNADNDRQRECSHSSRQFKIVESIHIGSGPSSPYYGYRIPLARSGGHLYLIKSLHDSGGRTFTLHCGGEKQSVYRETLRISRYLVHEIAVAGSAFGRYDRYALRSGRELQPPVFFDHPLAGQAFENLAAHTLHIAESERGVNVAYCERETVDAVVGRRSTHQDFHARGDVAACGIVKFTT